MQSQRVPALSRRRFSRTIAVVIGFVSTFTAGTAPAAASGSVSLDGRERAVLSRINAVRADHHLGAFTTRRTLSHAADRHASRLLARRVLSHQLPGEASLEGRLGSSAASHPVGEVVLWAMRQRASSAAIVRSWMDSPEHRALLLSGDFRVAGIGIRTGAGGLYATVDLAAG